MKEEEEERTEDRGEEGERVNLKTEKSEARDSIEERRKTEAGDEKLLPSKEEVDEKKKSIDGVKAELLDANNDSKPSLHLDPVQVVKAEVNNNSQFFVFLHFLIF